MVFAAPTTDSRLTTRFARPVRAVLARLVLPAGVAHQGLEEARGLQPCFVLLRPQTFFLLPRFASLTASVLFSSSHFRGGRLKPLRERLHPGQLLVGDQWRWGRSSPWGRSLWCLWRRGRSSPWGRSSPLSRSSPPCGLTWRRRSRDRRGLFWLAREVRGRLKRRGGGPNGGDGTLRSRARGPQRLGQPSR